jgi:NAD(P)-dependent dehydrogenase (short-subunit alcohol dehydrogenase family)
MTTRTVLVTGGNKGIGRACAERFWRDGHRVVVTGRDEAALKEVAAACDGVEPRAFDVTDADAWAGLDLDVDVLVANAGIAFSAPLHRTSVDDWNRVLAINASGVFLGAHAVVPGMRARGWGRLVVVASVAGHHGVRYGTAYSASKHAAIGLTRSVATEVAGTGVTANAVCPGFVATEMTERSVATIVDSTGRSEDEARQILEQMQPISRLVEPAEVAAAVAYHASDEAAAVTGQSSIIHGGGVQP